jgi:hypothetical protein
MQIMVGGSPSVDLAYSQHGEDQAIADRFGRKRGGYFVEVGALDGIQFSNTYYLERDLGWTGVLIEADSTQAEACAQNRPRSLTFPFAVTRPRDAGKQVRLSVVDGYNGMSTLGDLAPRTTGIVEKMRGEGWRLDIRSSWTMTTTLDDVLIAAQTPAAFDVMTIDIEGHEWPALQGMSLGTRWRPTVLVVENNGILPHHRLVVYLARRGYGYRRTLGGINLWFERGSVVRGLVLIYAASGWRGVRPFARYALQRLGLLALAKRKLSDFRRLSS